MNKLVCLSLVLVAFSAPTFAATTAPIRPVPTPYASIQQPADPNNFNFICTGDNRPPANGDPIMPVCTEICHEIGLLHPNFVFWTGDCIYGYKDTPDQANAEYTAFLNTLDYCGVPVYNAVGNHELGKDPGMTPIYEKRMGRLYGSMDYGNSHFISLNTDPIVNGAVAEGTIDPDQLAWLTADLQANSGAANIFVFMHHYVFGPPDPETVDGPDTGFASTDQRDQLHQLFVKYHVRAVFCGHSHIYWHAVKDGIDYYISGNAGAPLDASPENGGYFGYLMVTVTGNTFTATERAAGTLQERVIGGDDGVNPVSVVAIDAPEDQKITINGIYIKAPESKLYTVTATATNKGKVKQVPVTVLGTTPSGTTGEVYVQIQANLPGSRTAVITLTAG